MMFRPIHHTFAPHVDAAYALHALRLLFQPWKWQRGGETEVLRKTLAQHFHAEVTLFASGREAIFALLQSLQIGKGYEVIIQSYTCVVVPNAITATGATPIYADIDPDTLNLTPETVERVISNRTKAVICQHTFGIPADTERLRDLCDQYELPIIEDCAHIIPDRSGPATISRYGDYLILSFGRDKAISGIAGGALVLKNKNTVIPTPYHLPPTTYIARLLLYPLLYAIARPLYGFGLGKLLLWLAAKLHLLIPIVTEKEKKGSMEQTLHNIPNACAALALTQLRKLPQINDHRRSLTQFYLQAFKDRGWPVLEGITEDLPLQKFPMFIDSPLPRSLLKRKNIHLSDGWTGCIICPSTVDPNDAHYSSGQDPRAEEVGKSIFSLPTHPTMTLQQAKKLMTILASYKK